MKTLCVICDKEATKFHWSFMGQIKFHVCDEHYETTTSGMGCDPDDPNVTRMGLRQGGKGLDMKASDRGAS